MGIPSMFGSGSDFFDSMNLKPLNARRTFNIGTEDWLTQVQHKGDRVEVVDHVNHFVSGPEGDAHIIHIIDGEGNIRTKLKLGKDKIIEL